MKGSTALEGYLDAVSSQWRHAGSSQEKQGGGRGGVVTISRQAGSGSHVVAEALVARLQLDAPPGASPWAIFDKNLVEKVLEDHDLPERLAGFMPEDRKSEMADTLDALFGQQATSWTLVKKTAETILHLAEVGNVVIIGRGGNIITATLGSAFTFGSSDRWSGGSSISSTTSICVSRKPRSTRGPKTWDGSAT